MRIVGRRFQIGLLLCIFMWVAPPSVPAAEASTDQMLFLKARMLYEADKYRAAQALLEQAIVLKPTDSEYHRWLGKSYGRIAEGSILLTAFYYATKARKSFETAVALDAHNTLAMRDLLEFYVEAPGIMGGGMDKARPLARRLLAIDPSFSDEVKELLTEGD